MIWLGAVTLQYNENNTYRRPTLDYSASLPHFATVEVGKPVAIESWLSVETMARDEAADWYALADLYNTASYTVQSSTPGVQIIEVTPIAARPRLGIRRQPGAFQLFTADDPGADEFMLEFSTYFLDWDDVGVLSPAGSEWTINDPEPGVPSFRFYRAIRRQLESP